jgi:NAD(P)-dependent dehydrogenase (short-subunit alcohol dehydrogenase family)
MAGTPGGRLDGRVAIVTGGNGGLGFGFAEALLDAGAVVEIWGRNEAKAKDALQRLTRRGRPRVTARRCDVTDEASVEQSFGAAVAEHERVDALVANAGLGWFADFTETSLENWHRVTAADLDGVFLTFREAARHMKARHAGGDGGGALVAISSISALHGTPRHAAYAASKAGILGLVRSVAVELARYSIRANALLPGWMEIDTHPEMRENEKFVEVTTKRTPLRRWGVPHDLDAAIVYLADPANAFHTGDTLVLDGGYTIQ